jgi:V/A-type H+/Na+-transporting ATPase subunit A
MKRTGKIFAIVSNLVSVKVDCPVIQYEICHINTEDNKGEKILLLAEVIKIQGDTVYIQVFESTRGLKVGTEVEFTGALMEVELAPGLLSKNLDGLQNNLDAFEDLFLKKGQQNSPIDLNLEYEFKVSKKVGDTVSAGDWLGTVKENWIDHKIMVPFKVEGSWKISSIKKDGKYKVKDEVALIENSKGEKISVTMIQTWPVKRAIQTYNNKPRPFKVMETGLRCIDTLNPITEGGTGFIPGPFGCGKTVLQHIISQHAEADIIIVAACGERANEVVELFKEFPHLHDPRSGRKLMERTIIVCNTSNMPVAAREASVYTSMTIAEYYRQMGLRVLLLADSTSRWAQALREISNRMEELPGPDAFPMDLTEIISNFYSRAGYVYLNNGEAGSITFIGTVSPAGGNLKEPVTEATKKVARCFFGLAQQRADAKRYPAVDPIDSYSKYLEYKEVQKYLAENVHPQWVEFVSDAKNLLLRGKEAYDQINILGDDGVSIDYHTTYWRSELIDFTILQQDAFDAVDKATPMDRQRYMMELVLDICRTEFKFDDFEEVRDYYKSIINLVRQMNFSEYKSDPFKSFEGKLKDLLDERRVV